LANISLVQADRLATVNKTLSDLEDSSTNNQLLVDSLAEQVRQLTDSAEELRERYTEVQQHRDLLQDILRNVEQLDCRQQFEN